MSHAHLLALAFVALAACSSRGAEPLDGGLPVLTAVDAWTAGDAAAAHDAHAEAAPNRCQTGSDRFIKQVIHFDPGACAGFGADVMPGVVCGPPEGAGADEGSSDVVSLGNGGSIVVGFGDNEIIDGEGGDFIVFENPFDVVGNPKDVYAEPGEVSVSEDGVHWTSFPCTDTTNAPPYGQCAGVNPVYSNPDNDISPFAIPAAGGDVYDLATIGVSSAKYVRIRDIVLEECWPAGTEAGTPPNKNGFDLDAIAIVNAKYP
jgi:hypothetical protein